MREIDCLALVANRGFPDHQGWQWADSLCIFRQSDEMVAKFITAPVFPAAAAGSRGGHGYA